MDKGEEWYKVSELDILKPTQGFLNRKESGVYSHVMGGQQSVLYWGGTESDLCHRRGWLHCGEGMLGQYLGTVSVA